ncbi:elongation of very long chain fatty acids protein AAEL008004 isoform X2 [Scaptodrosophila lebanonensis]|uniref:Elongation of very long chain fatty acids protein n=1 Tax=Drosophila lebanonensis TaxID=7225 RepID=A0A6J2UJ94_DROLE|nr:elongation of very long chain fatty acids protein AAEL008004 isoform X2 [Scaptodrosophila lebanonensis]
MDSKNISEFVHPTIMSTPCFMVSVLAIYLVTVIYLGPRFMRRRQPFDLKPIIILHNVIQVLSCIYTVNEILQITGYQILLFWKCSLVPETHELLERHFKLSYFLFWLKISELIETVIFVLRKKQNQITKLHVFHHIATVTLIYLLINHNENSFSALYPIFLNSNVHIVMYSYYLVAAVADKKTIRALTPVKKSITVIQMVQFLFILMQAGIVSVKCGVPKLVFFYFVAVICFMFYGFYDFYRSSYKKAQRRKSSATAK